MATNGPWDPSLVDPTDRPADGLIIRSVGGRTGPISLENGATLSFPWKKQQQISGATPATMKVTEVQATPRHTQELRVLGGNLISGGTAPTLFMASPYADDAATGYGASLWTGARSTETQSYISMNAGVAGASPATRTIAVDSDVTTVYGRFALADSGDVTGQWGTFDPVIKQGATTITHTNTYSRRIKIGRTVIWSFLINLTSAGAASTLTLTVPFTAASASGMDVGGGHLYNGASNLIGPWALNATTTIALVQSGGYYGTAVASGNVVTGTITYEAAS